MASVLAVVATATPAIARTPVALREPGQRIDVDAEGVACPDEREVAAALRERSPEAAGLAGPLRLVVRSGERTALLVGLSDARANRLLEREIAGLDPSVATPESCRELASTVALVVTRYLRDLDYVAPEVTVTDLPPARPAPGPQPPAAPSFAFGFAYAPRSPLLEGGDFAHAGGVTADAWLGDRRRVHLFATGGLTGDADRMISGTQAGSFAVRVLPLQLGVGWAVPLGGRALVTPVVAAQADVIGFRSVDVPDARRGTRLEWSAGGGAVGLLQLTPSFALRAAAMGAWVPQPREFRVLDDAGTAWSVSTPGWQVRLSFGLVVTFGKVSPQARL